MRNFFFAPIAVVSTLALTQIASAADLPRKAPAAVSPPAPLYNWTGWYAGLNAGWVGSTSDTVTNNATAQLLIQGIPSGSVPTTVDAGFDGWWWPDWV